MKEQPKHFITLSEMDCFVVFLYNVKLSFCVNSTKEGNCKEIARRKEFIHLDFHIINIIISTGIIGIEVANTSHQSKAVFRTYLSYSSLSKPTTIGRRINHTHTKASKASNKPIVKCNSLSFGIEFSIFFLIFMQMLFY